MMQTYNGMKVIVQQGLTRTEPLFADKKWSKRRRRRVIGKYGRWSREVPAAYQVGASLICHPAIYARLQQQARANQG